MAKKINWKEFTSRILPIVIWAIIIFSLSADPEPYKLLPRKLEKPVILEIHGAIEHAEKIGNFLHVFEYAVLSGLISRGVIWKKKPFWGHILFVIGISSLFALSDEVHQIYIPNRAFELSDFFLDCLGVLFGIGIYLLIRKYKGTLFSKIT